MSAALTPIRLQVDGRSVTVPAGFSVAAAIAQVATVFGARKDASPRAPLCGMGVCFECRVRIDGADHQRACMTLVREGMRVETTTEPAHG